MQYKVHTEPFQTDTFQKQLPTIKFGAGPALVTALKALRPLEVVNPPERRIQQNELAEKLIKEMKADRLEFSAPFEAIESPGRSQHTQYYQAPARFGEQDCLVKVGISKAPRAGAIQEIEIQFLKLKPNQYFLSLKGLDRSDGVPGFAITRKPVKGTNGYESLYDSAAQRRILLKKGINPEIAFVSDALASALAKHLMKQVRQALKDSRMR